MKFFPLIWAALWRRPTRLILTLLSVSMAFTLFGVTIGFNASVQNLIARARLDRVFVGARFGGGLPLAYRDQVAQIPGVKETFYWVGLPAYYQDKKNSVSPLMVSATTGDVMMGVSLMPADWNRLNAVRNGLFVSKLMAARYHFKQGDQVPLLTVAVTRQDGGKTWPFTILGIVDDVPEAFNGYAVGNYDYLDETRPLARRGTANGIQLLVNDPNQAESIARAIDAKFANSGTPTSSTTNLENTESAAQAGINIPFVTTMVAGAGLFMILFLTGNGIAQSVRERIPEFAMLKTLGFSDAGVMTLVFVEAAVPCLLGAGIGIAASKAFAQLVPHLFPPNFGLPVPYMSPAVLSLAFGFAVIVAFVSAVVPALRIKRLNVASALMGH